jgi:hypothetical protein
VREEASRLFLLHTTSSSRAARRATLDHPSGSQHTLRAPRCWLFNQPVCEAEHAKPQSRLSGAYDAGMQGSLRLDLRRMIHHEGLQGFYPALALRRGFFM